MKANTTGFKIYRSHKSGSIIYNGHTLNEFFACKGLPAYISQTDHHLSELIVRETLDFAARCQGASEAFSGRMRELLQLEKEKDIHTSQKLMLLRRLCIGLHDIFNYLLWLELLLGVICIEAFQVVKQRGSLQVTFRKDQVQYWGNSSKPYRFFLLKKSLKHSEVLDSTVILQLFAGKVHRIKWELLKACFFRDVLLFWCQSFQKLER